MKLKKWISVQMEHDYFATGRCHCLRTVPTQACEKRMRRDSLLFYKLPGGYIIFKNDDAQQSAPPADPGTIDIAVYGEPLLSSFSNLDIDARNRKTYYIGNFNIPGTGEDSSGSGNGRKRITLLDRGGGNQWVAVAARLTPKRFAITFEEPPGNKTIQLVNRENKVVKTWSGAETASSTSLALDLGAAPPGLYTLLKNREVINRFYCDDQLHANHETPVFISGIQPPPEQSEQSGQSQQGGAEEGTARHYDIRIHGRPVTWKYHIIARANGRKLNNLQVKNNNPKALPGIAFEKIPMESDEKQLTFISSKPIPISQKAYQSVQLIDKGSNGTPLIPHLPNADLASLHKKEGKWESWIYVYI